MSQLSLRNVEKTFGDAAIIRGIDLDVGDGEFVVFVGPSGCGKSTLLRMIAGLEEVTEGEIVIGGKTVNDLPPVKRGIAMVFQSYALYPHLTVRQNIGFGLRARGVEKSKIDQKVKETAALLELTDYLDRKPAKLSGGQRQRVAMGRALVRSPNAFLMDEPLSNLDARLRGQMRAEIAKLQRMTAVTTVYVTHDQVEAMTMGYRVAVMNKGTLQQLDTPRALYDTPRNLFVAGFIGSPPMNFMRAVLESGQGAPAVRLGSAVLAVDGRFASLEPGRQVIVGIRPEVLRLVAEGEGFPASAAFVEDLGATLLVHLDSPEVEVVLASVADDEVDLGAIRPRLRAVIDGTASLASGTMVRLSAVPSGIHLFDPASGNAL